MRLICPNCGAQYEVDAGVIPETGRDVQCSNCGNTWFQRHARQEAEIEERRQGEAPPVVQEAAPDQDAPDQPPPQPDVGPESQPEPQSEPQPQSQSEPEPQPISAEESPRDVAASDPDTVDQTGDTSAPPDAPQQQKLGQDVADILRQEAEREARERASEAGGLESQPDLGLAAGPRAPVPQSTGASDGQDGSPGHDDGQMRGNLLPDIEEINSTLAATSSDEDSETEARDQEIRRRSGFRRGFTYAILIFAVMALVYVFSAKIAETVPQTGPALAAYVDWINGLRSSVDAMMLRAVDKLTGLLAQLSGSSQG